VPRTASTCWMHAAAISVTERAAYIGRIRNLSRSRGAKLFRKPRASGLPDGTPNGWRKMAPETEESSLKDYDDTENLLVELFVEELPPKALKKLGDAFATQLAEQLQGTRPGSNADARWSPLCHATPPGRPHHTSGSRRRQSGAAKADACGWAWTSAGAATPALLKKLQALGADVSDPQAAVASLQRAPDGKAEALFYDSTVNRRDAGRRPCKRRWTKRLPSCRSPRS
jgi:hypothetical protein